MKVLMIIVNVLSFHQQDMMIETRVTTLQECQHMKANANYHSSVECVPLANIS